LISSDLNNVTFRIKIYLSRGTK